MPSNFEVTIPYKGAEKTVTVERTTDDFPLEYAVQLEGDEKAKVLFYGTIPGPYDDAQTPGSEAYFAENTVQDPGFESAIAKAIVDHEKQEFPTLVPES